MRCAVRPVDKSLVSEVRMAFRQQLGKRKEWDPVEKNYNPCSSVIVESHLVFVPEEQKRVGALQ